MTAGNTPTVAESTRPVAIDATGLRPPNVAVVIVTWNRKDMVARVLEDLSGQSFPVGNLDVVVCDNASTDGTLEHLRETFNPDRIIENPTTRAHKPAFRPPKAGGPNTLGFRSLSIVRNGANMGGCGGFNTGFAFVERVLDATGSDARPDFVWLVDDDVRMPSATCESLVDAAKQNPDAGLIGTRTVHIENPSETIETTIYFNPETGLMDDHPHAGHRLEASHNEWASEVGGPKGTNDYSGVREVDVVSACSMLARWPAVKRVGFWDWRYFIYCDDADWCLRFHRAGYRVLLNLDATVLHTPWHYKLTPARLYYAQRNVIWMMQKVIEPGRLRGVVGRRLLSLLRDSMRAMLLRRQFHAEIIRRTAKDICVARTGKLEFDGPPTADIGPALEGAGLLASDRRIAFMCCDARSAAWAEAARSAIRVHAARVGRPLPRFIEIMRNDVPGAADEPPESVQRVVYAPRHVSRLRRHLSLLPRRPDAAVVFEQVNDFPLMFGRWNLHVDPKSIRRGQLEEQSLRTRLRFIGAWGLTCLRCATYLARLRPFDSDEKYGGVPKAGTRT